MLSKKQEEFMGLLWEAEKPLTRSQIIERSEGKRTWKESSFHIIVNGLMDKGMVEYAGFEKTNKNYGRTYVATLSAEEYAIAQLMGNEYLEEGRRKSLVSALVKGDQVSQETVDRLEKMLEQEE